MPVSRLFYGLFNTPSKPASSWLYNFVSMMDRDAKMLFMNYGYVSLDADAGAVALSVGDEYHRYPIQLYHHIASAVDWSGSDALEVGSGRGGGASYITRYFRPKSMIGMDIAPRAVEFCRRHYQINGLSFERGDAEHMRFPDKSFDIVLNVESSLYYPNLGRFFREVARVLRHGGHFLYADMRFHQQADAWRAQLRESGLEIIREQDITRNVLSALHLDRRRRQSMLKEYVPRLLHRPFAHFGGLTGADLAKDTPQEGERIYLAFVLRKS